MGSAYKNKGVQLLLDGVVALPARARPRSRTRRVDLDKDEAKVVLASDPRKPLVALAFKLEDGRYGQLTYMRIYQGTLARGDFIVNIAHRQEGTRSAGSCACTPTRWRTSTTPAPGDIVALFGVDCDSGDTFTDGTVNVAMTSMHVPEPVISLAVTPKDNKARDQHVEGAQPLHQGGPDLPRRRRRGVGRDDHRAAWASSTSTSTSSA